MPSGRTQDNGAGDMTPFIVFMAFVILTTVILISLYRINTEEEASEPVHDAGFTLTLDPKVPIVFSDDFLFPGFFPVSGDSGGRRPNLQQDVLRVRRLMADRDYKHAEDLLRTLFLFYPDDVEILYLLSAVLDASGRTDEADYYLDRMFFLLPSPLPDALPAPGEPLADERAAS